MHPMLTPCTPCWPPFSSPFSNHAQATKDQQTLSLSEHRTLVQQRLDQQRAQSAREIDEMRKETRSQLEHKERELRSWYEQKLEQASHAARSHSHKEREEALREVQKRCERLQAESTEASEQVSHPLTLNLIRFEFEFCDRSN